MSNIRINELKFSYNNDEYVFDCLNYTLRSNKTLSIIGQSASGKTTLLKILNGDLKYEGSILVNGKELSKNNKDIAVVLDVNNFVNELVKDELRFSLESLNIKPKEISKKIDEINDFFDIKKIFNKPIDMLSTNDRVLVKILSYAIYEPSYIAIDDFLCYLDERTKILLLNYLNYKNILLINVTSDLEDVLYTDYTICLYDKKIGIDGKSLYVLNEERVLKRLGFSLPFYIDLSIQLKLYGLINKVYYNKEELVRHLWK